MLKEFFTGVVDLLYPLHCLICAERIETKEFGPLCSVCFQKIAWNLPPFCSKCGRNIPVELSTENVCLDCKKRRHYFDRAWSVALYTGIMRECIHKFKYEGKLGLVHFFEKILFDFIERFVPIEKFDYLIPVPLHYTKLREREFNQALLLAQPIAKKFQKKLLTGVLYRKKFTAPQTELNAPQRRKNIQGAFGIRKQNILTKKNILIIDDVFTTGSTVDECAKLLKRNGANIVDVLSIAC
ncbi:MAG: ComF family protein [Candidatus Omnitrophica bacterium]|nr:ComF family protein [Candidatus Omnitrophota bacterium]MCM8793154.1 ComF family protein [Candidatus Omnitrophota bacterium]